MQKGKNNLFIIAAFKSSFLYNIIFDIFYKSGLLYVLPAKSF